MKIDVDEPVQTELNPACVVCGAQNPNGLHIQFAEDENGVWAKWSPTQNWESFQGVIHGGIITAVLDEAMSKAILAHDWRAFTAELTIRFRQRVSPGDELKIRGWIKDRHKRRIRAEAVLTAADGQELAHAWATFLTAPDSQESPPNSRPVL
jgi:acyl-coenzyme A thioesterase PaaI-like protein